MTSPTRRLAAIMFTDIVGYTALMAESEERGLRARERHRALVRPLVEQYHGESIEARGDESLSTFPTALGAVNCALAIEAATRDDAELNLHVGIHLGDVVIQDGEVSGDGVNIASRICALSEGGGICVSGEVYQSVRNQPEMEAVSLGERELKNVGRPVAVYALGRPGTVAGSALPPRPGFWNRGRSMVAVLALAVVALITWRIWDQVVIAPGPIRSIAVLPLENLSGDPAQEYFADGMTEALIGDLAKISSLRVISRTSVMQYKGVRRSLPEIARELNVEAVIQGTVLREGDRVRITAQLIDARRDAHLWADRFDRDVRGILALQSEIARAIADEVRVKLTPEETARLAERRPVDPEAHEAYLKGRYYLGKFTRDDAGKAVEHFEESIRIDPEYAPAHVELSLAYIELGGALMGFPSRDAMPKAKAAALRALDLDDRLASAHHALGSVLFFYDWDWDGAEKEFERVIAFDPSLAAAHYDKYASYLSAMGRHREAIDVAQRAVEVAPLDLFARTQLAQAFFFARDYDRGVQEVRETLELDPDYSRAHQWLAWLYELLGRYEEAVDARAKMATLAEAESAGEVPAIRAAYETDGPEGYWRALIQHQERDARITRLGPMHFVWPYALLGDADQAFAWLERAYEGRDHDLVFLRTDPTLDSIRSDPRFDDLLRRIGFPES